MPSTTDICNGALLALGETLITDIADTTTKEARLCNAAWDRVRRLVIRSHPWNCTMARADLAADVATPAFDFDYQFTLPADCLTVYDVENSDNANDWRVEGRKLLTDLDAPLGILYGKDETDSNVFDAMLVEVLSLTLAVELCEALTQSNTKKKDLQMRLLEVSSRAQQVDGWEGTPAQFEEDEWVLARWR